MTTGATAGPSPEAPSPPPGAPAPACPEPPTLAFSFPSDPARIGPALERVMEACGHDALPRGRARFALRVAVGEALANAVLHGNGADPGKRVDVEVDAGGDGVRVTVGDRGDGFDPDAVADPVRAGSRPRPRGRGLFLMRRLADGLRVDRRDGRVTVVVRP